MVIAYTTMIMKRWEGMSRLKKHIGDETRRARWETNDDSCIFGLYDGHNSELFTVTGNWKRDKFREDDQDIWFSPCPLWHSYELYKKNQVSIWIRRSVAQKRSLGWKTYLCVFRKFAVNKAAAVNETFQGQTLGEKIWELKAEAWRALIFTGLRRRKK